MIMKYGFSRKIQLKNYIKDAKPYESADFFVEGCDSREDAVEEIKEWIKEYIKTANERADKSEPFTDHELNRAEITERVEEKLNNKWDKEHPQK